MGFELNIVKSGDDLARLVSQINSGEWDDENDLDDYTVEALAAYLDTPDTVFITCHSKDDGEHELLGMASARIEIKPYQKIKWLYVDEVDVCCKHRQKGAGRALMNALVEFAKRNECEELWLGAETRNVVANKFYEALEPDDIASCIGYTFELEE